MIGKKFQCARCGRQSGGTSCLWPGCDGPQPGELTIYAISADPSEYAGVPPLKVELVDPKVGT